MKNRIIGNRTLIFVCSVFLLAAEFAFAQEGFTGEEEAKSGLHILYHEPFKLFESDQRSGASPDHLNAEGEQSSDILFVQIDAFGQSFDLELESNERLIADLPEAQREQIATAAKLYRGKIVGLSDSWVRLTRQGDQWSGMLWDGAEAYLIDHADGMSKALDLDQEQQRAVQSAPYPIIYRLSDVQLNDHCGLEPNAPMIHSYGAMADHLRDLFAALPVATEKLDMSVVGDVQFVQANSDPTGTLVARMNVVDGIYSNQVGVAINVVEIRPLSNNGPLTSSNASTLLSQFAGFARPTNPGLAHLFTGRNISGGVIGIAYLGVLCNSNFGAGVSEDFGSFGALVAAHEIGHNFGAPHDNQGGSPCASTPGNFLMNPSINGSDQFSQCSLNQMQPHIAAASCITSIPGGTDPTADVRPSLPVNPISATVDVPFDYEIEVRNSGDGTASGVSATITLPAALALQDSPGNCTDDSGVVTCNLGELAGDTNRQIELTLLGTEAGQFLSDVSVDAANDVNSTNNEVQATFFLTDDSEPCANCIDFSATATTSYSNQDNTNSGSVSVRNDGATLELTGNRWRRTVQTFPVTPNTVIEFDFRSTTEGEIHGIGFDEDNSFSNTPRIFQLFGTQSWGNALEHGTSYTQADLGNYKSFRIPVGEYYIGSSMYLVLVNDKDRGSQNNSSAFRNVRIFEDSPGGGGGCSVELDFEAFSDTDGWINSPESTCATGAFVWGTPTQQRSTVITQVAGDHTTGSGNAIFTAQNQSAGNADVDRGTCVLESPTWTIADASEVSVWYFHGQRDAGDDSGDGFLLEISTDGGNTYNTLVAIGDVRTSAVWTEAQRTIGAGSSVKLRVQVSDGARTGDIVEGGIDDLSICAQ